MKREEELIEKLYKASRSLKKSLGKGFAGLLLFGSHVRGEALEKRHRHSSSFKRIKRHRLSDIVKGLELVCKEFGMPIVYPIHPRTRKRLKEFDIDLPPPVRVIEPLDYLSFLKLESSARLILTDSGGVQEEACILKVPCVTLRHSTERPETLEVGANILTGSEPKRILDGVKIMLSRSRTWPNPYGDGKAARRIVNIILNSK